MMPIPDGVVLPLVLQHLQTGQFVPPASAEPAIGSMLGELLRWTNALRPLRTEGPPAPMLPPSPPLGPRP
jgi:hypothetical protein